MLLLILMFFFSFNLNSNLRNYLKFVTHSIECIRHSKNNNKNINKTLFFIDDRFFSHSILFVWCCVSCWNLILYFAYMALLCVCVYWVDSQNKSFMHNTTKHNTTTTTKQFIIHILTHVCQFEFKNWLWLQFAAAAVCTI